MTRALDASLNAGLPPRNLMPNPAMQVSQEFYTTGSSITSGALIQPVDGATVYHASDGVLFGIMSTTPSPGGGYRLAWQPSTADTSLSAAQVAEVLWAIEGYKAATLEWGTAKAKPVTFRCYVNLPAGLYTIAFRNGALNRHYLKSFTISAGQALVDTLVQFTIPGDTSGTWARDNTPGLYVSLCFGAGSTAIGTPEGAWSASTGQIALAGQFNLMASTANVGQVMDVGLYEGTVAPPFEVPDFADELRRCQRYLEYVHITCTTVGYAAHVSFAAQKRTNNPTITLVAGGTGTGGTVGGYGPAAGGVNNSITGAMGLRQQAANSSGAIDAIYKVECRL
jgi:hypothetical protein